MAYRFSTTRICRYCGAHAKPPFCKSCGGVVEEAKWARMGEPFFYRGHRVTLYREAARAMTRIVIELPLSKKDQGEIVEVWLPDEERALIKDDLDIVGLTIDMRISELPEIKIDRYVVRVEPYSRSLETVV